MENLAIVNKSESIINIVKAIVSVMKSVVGVDKNLTVGEGKSAYQGVADKDVKKIIGSAMSDNGLCIVPIGIAPNTKIERWEEDNSYGKKIKQSVFTDVLAKYLLCHESGEFIELIGYGQGVDAQDKGAGKATTYALKHVLLYTFLVPTGKIDDSDNDHSDNKEVPGTSKKQPMQKSAELPCLNKGTKQFEGAVKKLIEGTTTIDKIKTVMRISEETMTELLFRIDKKNKTEKPEKKKTELLPGTSKWSDALLYLTGEGSIEKIEKKYTISTENRELLLSQAI